MNQRTAQDKRIRKNISMLESVIAKAQELTAARNMGAHKFSQLLSDLVLATHQRQAAGGDKSPEQYLTQIVDLLEKNKALEAKLKEKVEGFKLERKSYVEALHLCEEDLKKARSSAT